MPMKNGEGCCFITHMVDIMHLVNHPVGTGYFKDFVRHET